MVSPRLRKHAREIVYLQKARPCVSKHIIDKADRSLIECLCECADNILKGNVQLTPAQRDKLKKNRSGLRDLVKKSVSLKRRKSLLKKGTKTLGREAKRIGLNIAGDVVQGKNVKHASQSTENDRKRSEQGHRIRRTTWRKDCKKTCERKRPDNGTHRTTSSDKRWPSSTHNRANARHRSWICLVYLLPRLAWSMAIGNRKD